MYIELSHRLGPSTPVAPGVPPPEFRQHYSIQRGDVSNLFVLKLSNHFGTHVDAPWHFVDSGLKISDFTIEECVFDQPLCLDLPMKEAGLITANHLKPYADQIARCDLLLLRTGYSAIRGTDPERYRSKGPGMSVEGASYLAANFPRLRALGLDTISLACMEHLEEGLEAHRVLLRGEGRRFLIVEDMKLEPDLSRLRSVIVLPLFIEGIDSSPCTVMGVIP
jgi:arylformamidase